MALIVLKAAGFSMALNYGVHLASAHVYDKLCIPQTIWDIPQSIVATASPICIFLVSAMQATQNTFANVLTTTVSATVASLLRPA